MNLHRNKLTNESKGKLEQKFDAAYGTNFITSKCFHGSKNFILNFSLELGRLKILKLLTHVNKVLIYLYRHPKNIQMMT